MVTVTDLREQLRTAFNHTVQTQPPFTWCEERYLQAHVNTVLLIGDIHLIQPQFTDTYALAKLIETVAKEYGTIDCVVLLGDVVDGSDKYATQIFKQASPQDYINLQRLLVDVLFEILERYLKPRLIAVTKGNHEDMLKEDILFEICFHRRYIYCRRFVLSTPLGKMVFLHSVKLSTRGSMNVGATPQIIDSMLALKYIYGSDVVAIAQAHIHKMFIHNVQENTHLMILPAFLIDDRAVEVSMKYNNAVVVLDIGNTRVKVDVFTLPKTRPEMLLQYNMFIISEALKKIHVPEDVVCYVM